jgi:hypothetical protein
MLHEPHITCGGAPYTKHPSFQAVNAALGSIKTSLLATYHVFACKKYGQRILGQIQYLFNRRYRLRPVLIRLARDAAQAAPRPLKTARSAEVSC